MYGTEEMIGRNPRFWRAALTLGILSQWLLLPRLFNGTHSAAEIAVALFCTYLILRYLVFAHRCVRLQDVLRIRGRRLFVSGSAEYKSRNGRALVYAGDVRALLEEVGGVFVEDARGAEFRVHLERATSLVRFEDSAGRHRTFQINDHPARSIAPPLGRFISESDTLRSGGVVLPFDWSDPRVRRIVLAAALGAQVLLAWHRGIFVWQQPAHIDPVTYVLTMGGFIVTTWLLMRTHYACGARVPAVSGIKVFVTGRGKNLDGRMVEAADFAGLLGAQGAIIVADRDAAEFEIHLADISAQIKDRQGAQVSAVMDENMIVSELRRLLKARGLPTPRG